MGFGDLFNRLKTEKKICYSKFCFEESLKEKKKNKLIQKAKETKKYYSSRGL